MPVDKTKGDEVFSGTINGQGAIEISVTSPAEETVLAKIIHLVQEAKNEKPPAQLFLEKFEGIYAKVVVLIAVLLMVLPPYLLGWNWDQTIYRAMIFLVVASPCALVSSIMPAMLSAISNAARHGVLFKGGVHLQNIGGVKVVAFDKTGTLTVGQPKLVDILPFGSYSFRDELLRVTASVETLSEHPIAKAIVQAAIEKNIPLTRPVGLQAIHGLGVQASLDLVEYSIGKRNMITGVFIDQTHDKIASQLEEEGKTVIFIAAGQKLIGVMTIQDKIRPWVKKIISDLRDMGIRTAMLTGDSNTTALAIAKQAGIEDVYSELMPQQKVEVVQKLEVYMVKLLWWVMVSMMLRH
ncbi:HAD-IC family P-type ATPase [Pedobacter sp. NJ-S-72]